MKRSRVPLATFFVACLVGLSGCEQVDQVRDHWRGRTPREAYLASLSEAGLAQTAMVQDWVRSSLDAVAGAPAIRLPFQEEGFIAPERADAVAYRVHIGRGQRLNARVDVASQEGTRVFVDLFRVPTDSADALRPVLSADSVPGDFAYEPWRGGDFILRIQPELLRGGRYNVRLSLEAQLAFPVEGKDERALWSLWGGPRDGGRRTHEGVDIFASRGDPVVAAADGVVGRVQTTNLGGKVVWLRDPVRNASLYFAHLDSQVVRSGQRVSVGDTLGFVGNTGNARTTHPHLHFGIYRRGEGPVDPAPFLRQPRGTMAALTADLDLLGSWAHVRDDGIRLRVAPAIRADVVRELERDTPMRIMGGSGSWYHVVLGDGTRGWVAARLAAPMPRPVAASATATADTDGH